MSFEGIAIYVFFILPNTQANPQVTANTAVNFTIDGQIVGNFTHEPDSSTTDFIFDQMVFNKTDLPQGTHQLIISASGINISTFTNFDYAMYTKQIDDPISVTSATRSAVITQLSSSSVYPSPSSTGSDTRKIGSSMSRNVTATIIGATIGGIILIGAITALFFWRRLHKRKN